MSWMQAFQPLQKLFNCVLCWIFLTQRYCWQTLTQYQLNKPLQRNMLTRDTEAVQTQRTEYFVSNSLMQTRGCCIPSRHQKQQKITPPPSGNSLQMNQNTCKIKSQMITTQKSEFLQFVVCRMAVIVWVIVIKWLAQVLMVDSDCQRMLHEQWI